MRIAVLHDRHPGERRVAISPEVASKLIGLGHEVHVEQDAGLEAGLPDDAFRKAGATIAPDRQAAVGSGGVVVSVNPPLSAQEIPTLGAEHTMIAMFDPVWRPRLASEYAQTKATTLSLELVPRITRAQAMDVLSSMATVAGYQAVLEAAARLPKLFPMLMTAAGTVAPARVLVVGAGVAGLQAIATARRLGAVVEGYDIRPAAAEQIRSLGARAIELDLGADDTEDAGGYARIQDIDVQARQQEALLVHLAAADLVITTAAMPGAKSPELITKAMVEAMSDGSMIMDLAAERGGNCELTEPNIEVIHMGVTVLGPTNLASGSPGSASQMFASNVLDLVKHLSDESGQLVIDADDEITGAMIVATGGEVVHPLVQTALGLDPIEQAPAEETE